MKKDFLFVFVFSLIFPYSIFSNNIEVSNVRLSGQNQSDQFTFVEFDLKWENSWRTSSAPNNWDAAWVFVKYRVGTGAWSHARLNNNGHSTGSGTPASIAAGLLTPGSAFNATTNPALGVFIYRSGDGSGDFTANNVRLRWNYGANSVANAASVDIKVFAVEMVYVPQGSFELGDGATTGTTGSALGYFSTNVTSSTTRPSQACCGNGSANELHQIGNQPPVANYPNGFNAFYMMKYPVTQRLYAQFLNTLTRAQQAERTTATTVGNFMSAAAGGSATPQFRNGIKLMSDNGSTPRVYGNDLNNNGTPYESADGMDIACNFLNGSDLFSILDWMGFRPMTVMEFEKAARGAGQSRVLNEYPWGNTTVSVSQGNELINLGTEDEDISNTDRNVVKQEALNVLGPVRVGIFARPGTTRTQSGAGYYGAMHMADNVHTFAINLVRNTGRTYNGSHGNGDAVLSGWPAATGDGVSIKGSCWHHGLENARISRHFAEEAGSAPTARTGFFGGRGVRTAPNP